MIDDPGPPGDDRDWAYWIYRAPVAHFPVEIWKKDWGNETRFLSVNDVHPAMNIHGLWWRPA